MTLDDAIAAITAATTPADLFGLSTPDIDSARYYRTLARLCHPDRVPPTDRGRASAAMAKLTALYHALTKPPAPPPTILGNWIVFNGIAKGGLTDIYSAERVGSNPPQPAIIKIARDPKDSMFISVERTVLNRLHADNVNETRFLRYLPAYLDSFEASYRRANVLSVVEGGLSLEAIRRSFPNGLDFRHVVWMMNRLLSVLGFVHHNGIIHGAILPQHLIYTPADHGLVLIDWTCACAADPVDPIGSAKIPYITSRYKDHYPREVIGPGPRCSGPSTDIYMAFAAMWYAAGTLTNVPQRFRPLFEWGMLESPKARPWQAWEVQDRWQRAAKEEYGDPVFVELKVPVN